jgi:hypothetical protein
MVSHLHNGCCTRLPRYADETLRSMPGRLHAAHDVHDMQRTALDKTTDPVQVPRQSPGSRTFLLAAAMPFLRSA